MTKEEINIYVVLKHFAIRKLYELQLPTSPPPYLLASVTDPNYFHHGSEFFSSRIRIIEFKYFNQKMVYKLSEIRSGLFIPDPDLLPIPDPWVKKAPDLGSVTLLLARQY